jgi:hypothetical protein
MKPVLVIDLFHPSPAQQQLKKMDEHVTNVLKVVKIPLIRKQICEKYDIDELRVEMLTAMNSTTVAYLKEKIIENVKNK